jgi:hypothetical protein
LVVSEVHLDHCNDQGDGQAPETGTVLAEAVEASGLLFFAFVTLPFLLGVTSLQTYITNLRLAQSDYETDLCVPEYSETLAMPPSPSIEGRG